MKTFLSVIGAATLTATLAFPIAYLLGLVELSTCKLAMLVATIAWFARAIINLVSNDDSAGDNPQLPAVPQDAKNG